MPRHLKRHLFKLYVPMLIISLAVAVAWWRNQPEWLAFSVSGIALAHFVQKEELQELELFHRMFGDFNARYDRLNDSLQGILSDSRPLTVDDRSTLLDYFNLCSEEFFFYSEGLVPRVVWQTWCRGICEYLEDARIAGAWEEEEARGSYYGLTHAIIVKSADCGIPDHARARGIQRAA